MLSTVTIVPRLGEPRFKTVAKIVRVFVMRLTIKRNFWEAQDTHDYVDRPKAQCVLLTNLKQSPAPFRCALRQHLLDPIKA